MFYFKLEELNIIADVLNMKVTGRKKKLEWQKRAKMKKAIVPYTFQVTPIYAVITCGKCHTTFQRNLIKNVNEPTFICPNPVCKSKNWLPITYNIHY